MATFDGITYNDPVHAGEYGNKTVAHGKATFVTASSGAIGSKMRYCNIPAGSKIMGFREAHAALSTGGAAATLEYGWEYADGSAGGGSNVLLAATSADAAGGTVATGLVPFVVEKDIIITSTVSVEACNGDSHVIVDYIHRGTK